MGEVLKEEFKTVFFFFFFKGEFQTFFRSSRGDAGECGVGGGAHLAGAVLTWRGGAGGAGRAGLGSARLRAAERGGRCCRPGEELESELESEPELEPEPQPRCRGRAGSR